MPLKSSYFFIFCLCIVISGCFTYNPNWQIPESESSAGEAEDLIRNADRMLLTSYNAADLEEIINLYESALQVEPDNFEALSALGHLYLLRGDGYCKEGDDKKNCFKKALYYNERAMYTNPDFKELIDNGAEVWEAVEVLSEREMEPMLFWATAVFYYYKESLGPLGQMINFRWIKRARRVMERMSEVNPDFGGGAVHFTWALYYLAIPESVGGDREKSEVLFAKAIEVGDDWLLNRWGRAKYFHVKMQNREQFKKDLEWVIAQNVSEMQGHRAWKTYFVDDARNMLDHIDEYF